MTEKTPDTQSAPSAISINAVLPVHDVELSARFFEKVGFSRDSEVSEDPADPSTPLGFVIMKNDKCQLMVQSIKSIQNDAPTMLAEGATTTLLFIIVENLDAVVTALAGEPVFMERRKTFYGADEIGITSPGGHKITFAEFSEEAAE